MDRPAIPSNPFIRFLPARYVSLQETLVDSEAIVNSNVHVYGGCEVLNEVVKGFVLTDSRQLNGRAVLGERVRDLRKRLGKTLLEIGDATGMSKSTVSKIENGTLSVSYDNLLKLARALSIDLATLFSEGRGQPQEQSSGRRSITRGQGGEIYNTEMYRYEMLCADLAPRKMFPMIATLRAHASLPAVELIRHTGEEFAFVLSGAVEVRSEFYNPITLSSGDCIYFDSSMGHALLSVGDTDARILWVATNGGPVVERTGTKSPLKQNIPVRRR